MLPEIFVAAAKFRVIVVQMDDNRDVGVFRNVITCRMPQKLLPILPIPVNQNSLCHV